jgi:hypothetical protein|tara:strand:- start:15904 stop:16329 length:426 start_codon:yes stop_codon:yes gene_type:complete
MNKTVLYVFGAILAVVGIVGFFNDPVLGIFETDTIHNIINIVAGLVLLGAAWKGQDALATKVIGVVLVILAVLGFIAGDGMILGFIQSNFASDLLHVIVGVILLYFGFAKGMSFGGIRGGGGGSTPPTQTPPQDPGMGQQQ